jgi:uncharacterized protein YjbJ (UPF0337 family)
MTLCRHNPEHAQKEAPMNWDQFEGKWKQIKGLAKAKWGDMTDDDLTKVEGKRDHLVGLVQEKYGHAKADAEREVDDWYRAL